MQLFYSNQINDDIIILSEDEAKHCIKSVRKEAGDEIRVVDGNGNLYITELIATDKKICELRVKETSKELGKRTNYVHIAIAPTKNLSRIEWFVEKAIEIGVDEISFIDCENSERNIVKLKRIERIAISAMKQSIKAYLPKINDMQSFSTLISNCTEGNKFIGYLGEKCRTLSSIKPINTCMLIGPEGDFTKNEISNAEKYGFEIVSLGDRRLRTETAGIVSCMILNDSE